MKNFSRFCCALFCAASVLSACAGQSNPFDNQEEVRLPIMGWSSWNTFLCDISEELICGQADAMVETGLKDAGYSYINIDDGYTDGRGEDGFIRIDTTKFPNGMKVVADYIHSKGLKAGIYADGGNNNCGTRDVRPYGLEVGLWRYEEQDTKMYFDNWNYDFIKIDFCGGLWRKLDVQEQYTKIADAIHKCDKQDIRFNVCRWAFPGVWVREVADSWRTTNDIELDWASIKRITLENVYLSAYVGGGHYNDLDMLEIGRELPEDEERTHMAVWCIMSSPIIIGCDFRTIPERSLELLKNQDLLAMDQDRLGISGAPVAFADSVLVLAKDMETFHGPKRAVVVTNLSGEEASIDVPLADLGFRGKVAVYDCFQHADRQDICLSDHITVKVAAHGSEAFYLTGKRIDKTSYQAEEAFLNAYSELEEHADRTPHVYFSTSADLGMYACGLGGREDNWMEWQKVESSKGGRYVVTVRYACADESGMKMSVNGAEAASFDALNTGAELEWAETSAVVELNAGYNTIRLENADAAMPAIDRITVKEYR